MEPQEPDNSFMSYIKSLELTLQILESRSGGPYAMVNRFHCVKSTFYIRS